MDETIKLLIYAPDPLKSYSTMMDGLGALKNSLSSGNVSTISPPTAVQACVWDTAASNPTNAKKEDETKCSLTSLTISSGKKSTSLSPGKSYPALEIVGGYKKNKKTVSCSLALAGPCANHNNKTFDVLNNKQKSNTDLSIITESTPFYKIFDTGIIFPWNAIKTQYTINANTCGNSISGTLLVYPDIDISIDIPVSFSDSEQITQKITNSEKNAHVYTQETSALKLKAKYKEDGAEWKISPSIEEKFKKVKDLKKIADNAFGTLQKAFDETIKIKFEYPKGSIHFDYKYKEKESPFKVGSEWHAQFNIDPLIGATVTIQLDELLLNPLSPVGKLYIKIKDALKHLHIGVKLEFIVSGKLAIDSGLSKEIGSDTEDGIKGGAGITGKIEADLKASGELKVQILIVAIEASAEAGAKTGIEASGGIYQNSDNLGLDLKFKFLGVTFYYEYKVSGSYQRNPGKNVDTTKANLEGSEGDKITVGAEEWPIRIPLSNT
jgi:hypothetical protein